MYETFTTREVFLLMRLAHVQGWKQARGYPEYSGPWKPDLALARAQVDYASELRKAADADWVEDNPDWLADDPGVESPRTVVDWKGPEPVPFQLSYADGPAVSLIDVVAIDYELRKEGSVLMGPAEITDPLRGRVSVPCPEVGTWDLSFMVRWPENVTYDGYRSTLRVIEEDSGSTSG